MIENTVLKSTRNRGEMLLKIDYYSTYENTHPRNVIPIKHDNYLMAFTDYSAFSVFIALIRNQLTNPFQERTKTGEKKITKLS